MRIRNTKYALVAIAALSLATAAPAGATNYTITDLGTLGGGMSGAWDVTAGGLVIGQTTLADTEMLRGFAWDAGLTELPPTGARPQSVAFAANSLGDIVGVSYQLGEPTIQATLWNSAGTPTLLGGFVPRAVNDLGVVAGAMTDSPSGATSATHAVRWQSGTLLDLGTLGGDFSAAHGINSSGWIVGTSTDAGDAKRAFLWMGGAMHDLGTLGGATSQALAINDSGAVAGVSETAVGVPHAFVYNLDASGNVIARIDLGVLAGETSHAYDINNPGEAVGTSDWRAFLWQSGQMIDLNDRISDSTWELTHATAINDVGQIVGRGRHAGQWRAFLLTPTACAGDVTGDGLVNITDLGVLLSNYGAMSGATREDGDLNGDGAVNISDLGELLAAFGSTCQ